MGKAKELYNRLRHGGPKHQARKAEKKKLSETYGTKEWKDRSVKEAYEESEFKGRLARARGKGYAHGVHIEDTGGTGLIGKLTRASNSLNNGLGDFSGPSPQRRRQGGGGGGDILGMGMAMDFEAMAGGSGGAGIGAFNMDGAFSGGGSRRPQRRRKRGKR